MDSKTISRIVKKAKQNYFKKVDRYNQFLENKTEFIPLDYLINPQSKQDLSSGQGQTQQLAEQQGFNSGSMPQAQQYMPPVQQPFQGPRFNIIGNSENPNVPINIIAKNYINTDDLENGSDDDVKKKVKKSYQLSKIPNNLLKKSATDWEPINYKGVNDAYDLYKLSRVEIFFDERSQKLIYNIIEPVLDENDQKVLEELKKAFIYVFEKIHSAKDKKTGSELIIDGTRKLCSKYKIKLTQEQFEKITYYLERDFLGLDVIEPIMHDPYVEDISCDGLGIPIFVNHLKYGPLETNRLYVDGLKLNSFIIKLAQKSNQEVSLSKPILQGALPDGSRIEAIYGKEVSEKGSSFTIRKFRAEPFTPVHLMEFGTMPAFLLAYLWLAVENKQSIMISGGTATGKTTILNALSLFVPPTAKVVSIEDTPEINLPHEHWLPLVARDNQEKSSVSMFDLLKASLRERPDYIIVGEVRGAEASILFQGMATGHAGLGTVHAEKFNDLVNRMTIAPINLPKQLLTELKLVIFMRSVKVKENIVRRAIQVVEIIDYNSRSDKFEINEFLQYLPKEDSFNFEEKSFMISHLLELRGGNEDALWNEIEKRRRILEFMNQNKISEFKDVSKIIQKYYQDPGNIFEWMEDYASSLTNGSG